MARAVIINVAGVDSVNGVADETLVSGPWDPDTIGISGGENLDFFPAIYSEDFTPGGTVGFFLGHWPDGAGGQFSAIKVNVGFIGGWNITNRHLYALESGTPGISPNNGIILDSNGSMVVREGNNLRLVVGRVGSGIYGIRIWNTSQSQIIFEASDTQQIIGGIEFDDGSLFSPDFVSGQEGFKIFKEGSAEFENITARGEFRASVLVQDEIHALGGQFMANTAGILLADMITVTSPTTFTMDIKDPPSGHNQIFLVNDLVRVKDGSGKDNFIRIDSASDQTTFYRYTCTKQNGTNGTFYAGTAIVYWGNTTVGNLLNIVGVGTDAPYIDIFSHTGEPWSSTSINLRIGNLDGVVDADFVNLGGYGLYADNIFLKGSYQSSAGGGKRITINEDEGSGANNALIFYDGVGEVLRIDDDISFPLFSTTGPGMKISAIAGGIILDTGGSSNGVYLTPEGLYSSTLSGFPQVTGESHFYTGIDTSTAVLALHSSLGTELTAGDRIGFRAEITNSHLDTVPDFYGVKSTAALSGSGTAYGIYASSIHNGTVVGDSIALYATASNDSSGSKYSIYAAAGDVYIADRLGIGTASPGARLDVVSPNVLGDISPVFATSGTLTADTGYSDPMYYNKMTGIFRPAVFSISSDVATLYLERPLKLGSGQTTGDSAVIWIAEHANLAGFGGNNYSIYSANTSDSYFAGNVGIGTINPGAKLHVVGSIFAIANVDYTGLKVGESTTKRGAMNWRNTLERLEFNTYNNNYPIDFAGSYLTFSPGGGAEKVRIDPNGNVGIGIAGPAHILDIRQNNTTGVGTRLQVQNTNSLGTGNNFAVIAINNHDGATASQWYTDPNGIGPLGRDAIYFGNFVAKDIGIFTNNVERITVASDGDVGISDTSPTVLFSVKGESGMDSGGVLIRLTNKTGGNSVEGQLVQASSVTPLAFATGATNADNIIGIVYEAGIADGSECWVVTAGIAEVLMDAGGAALDDRLISSSTPGSADVWNTGGAVATHFQEIGHCIEPRLGAGLIKAVLHFN